MNIDTEAIRRLRDHLLTSPELSSVDTGSHDVAEAHEARATFKKAILMRVKPFAETMYLVMVCDQSSDAMERKTLISAIALLTDSQLDIHDIEDLLEEFDLNVRQIGIEARLAQLGTWICADADDRETAFSLGAVVALADERVDPRENDALQLVRKYYGISDRRAAGILGSME